MSIFFTKSALRASCRGLALGGATLLILAAGLGTLGSGRPVSAVSARIEDPNNDDIAKDDSKATLEETLKWFIRNVLADSKASFNQEIYDGRYKGTCTNIEVKDGYLVLYFWGTIDKVERRVLPDGEYEPCRCRQQFKDTFMIPAKKVQDITVNESGPTSSSVHIRIKNGEKLLRKLELNHLINPYGSWQPDPEKKSRDYARNRDEQSLTIVFDQNVAESRRVEKALRHLVRLIREMPEKDNRKPGEPF